ncbi:hypothetical protein FQA39_LY11456 [Lamprigera yunnana]|nr:hypothetical protein FQA39_LY11456 [Lamprigera yunnana]
MWLILKEKDCEILVMRLGIAKTNYGMGSKSSNEELRFDCCRIGVVLEIRISGLQLVSYCVTMYALRKLLFLNLLSFINGDYWSGREALINVENGQALGGDIQLNEKETIVNQYLTYWKLLELDDGFDDPGVFLPSRHFFESRTNIEKSKVFDFIRQVPKGAALHGHDTALLSFEGLYNLTYEDNLYACTINGRLKLKFQSTSAGEECEWKLLKDLREINSSYDQWLQSQLTLVTDNPSVKYHDINDVWQELNEIFSTVTTMVTYRPVFEKYFYRVLQELHDDNVFYLEFRSKLPIVYELNGTTYDPIQVTGIYKKIMEDFKHDHPDFLGARMIYAPRRNVSDETIKNYVNIVHELKRRYPDFLVGFDFVGQEDKGRPLVDFLSQIQNVSENISFILHAGETNWYGASTDLNLIDAVLLGTKRIGHGYAIIKHPTLMQLAKEKNIALEVCPISNQVLMLVSDLRNHPASFLISIGYPIVISYDDPTFWGSRALSYDFYMAFMGMANRSADLRLLKKLSENSMKYSALPEDEKLLAIEKWNLMWDTFIDAMYDKI